MTARRIAGLLWLVVAPACHDATSSGTTRPPTPPTPIPALAYVSADISALQRIELGGGVFSP